jgi:RNA polymerase sigma-54 factor
MLKQEGIRIARRTVAKYREQIGLPIARMRRKV